MSERERGCGFRTIGAIYLVSDPGIQLFCDGLPLELEPCECCGFKPPFTRNLQRTSWMYIRQAEMAHHTALKARGGAGEVCSCPNVCPICHPYTQEIQGNRFGLMHVGKKFYTPRNFVQEAMKQGISKKIGDIPSWLKLGETWILLAHDEVPKIPLEQLKKNQLLTEEPETFRAVFYAFKPSRVEMPVWKNEISNEEIQLLEKKGITPVLLDPTPANKKRHKTTRTKKLIQKLLRAEEENQE